MRTFSPNVQAALDRDPIRVFYLIRLDLTYTYRFTSFPSDITFDGGVYVSDGGVISVSSYRNNSVVDRAAYTVTFSDNDELLRSEIKGNNVIGKPISVKVGFLDADGRPMLDPADIINVYNGTIDRPRISNNFEEMIVSLEGSSPMDAFDAVNVMMVSKDGMNQYSDTDTSFDKVYDNVEIELNWGKI